MVVVSEKRGGLNVNKRERKRIRGGVKKDQAIGVSGEGGAPSTVTISCAVLFKACVAEAYGGLPGVEGEARARRGGGGLTARHGRVATGESCNITGVLVRSTDERRLRLGGVSHTTRLRRTQLVDVKPRHSEGTRHTIPTSPHTSLKQHNANWGTGTTSLAL